MFQIIFSLVTSLPVAKNDLIQGQEFVLLYINNQPDSVRTPQHNPSAPLLRHRRGQHKNISETNSTSAEDDLQLAASSYESRYTRPATISIDLNATPAEEYDDTEEDTQLGDYDSNRTTVVGLVTTGSKIVFIEDGADTKKTNASSKSSYQHDGLDKSNSYSKQPSDEIKVTSISISSSTKQSNPPEREYNEFPYDDGDSQSAHQPSSLGTSQFSIEEDDDIYIEKPMPDSNREESMKLERILSAPSQGRSLRPLNPLSDNLDSIKGLIIHDQDYQKGGGARPRSVSYSSISQSLNQASPWRGSIRHNRTEDDQPDVQLQTSHDLYPKPKSEKLQMHYSEPERVYSEPAKIYSEASKVYSEPSKVYSEPAKVYSEPAKVYSEPEKIYSEPAKVYSEPARIYSEPAKVYSKPSKVYSEPSKVYGEPSKVYSQSDNSPSSTSTLTTTTTTTPKTSTTSPSKAPPQTATVYYSEHQVSPVKRVIFNLDKLPYDLLNAPASDEENKNYLFAPHLDAQRFHHFNRKSQDQQFQSRHQLPPSSLPLSPSEEKTKHREYESSSERQEHLAVKPLPSASTPHQESPHSSESPEDSADDDDPKVGFVVEGRNFRKYRVEEKTPDGFIVGEYGVVSTNDGSLRGVRYTADSNISPNLIYEALMKFLAL